MLSDFLKDMAVHETTENVLLTTGDLLGWRNCYHLQGINLINDKAESLLYFMSIRTAEKVIIDISKRAGRS